MSQLPDKKLEIFTDAQYVCNVLYAIEKQYKIPLHHKMANYDLISILNKHWNSAKHRIFKVKAHRKFEEAKDYNDLWKILGNHWADHAAAMAVAKINEEITKTADDAVSFEKSEQENLRTVLSYFIDLNIQQMKYHQFKPSFFHSTIPTFLNSLFRHSFIHHSFTLSFLPSLILRFPHVSLLHSLHFCMLPSFFPSFPPSFLPSFLPS